MLKIHVTIKSVQSHKYVTIKDEGRIWISSCSEVETELGTVWVPWIYTVDGQKRAPEQTCAPCRQQQERFRSHIASRAGTRGTVVKSMGCHGTSDLPER